MPSAAHRSMTSWIWARAPMSMPWVGSSSTSTFGPGPQRSRHENLLLVAAGQARHRRVGSLGDDPETVDPLADLARVPGCGLIRPHRRWRSSCEIVMFARTPRLGNTPSRARSPGTAATPAATTPRGRARREPRPPRPRCRRRAAGPRSAAARATHGPTR